MRERDGMALGLAYLFGAGATLVVLSLLVPHGHGASVPALVAIAATAYVVTGVLALRGGTLPAWSFGAVLVFGSILIGACAWWGGEAAHVYPLMYIWVALYGFYFFPPRFAFLVSAFSAGSYAVVLGLHDVTPVPWIDGIMVVGTALVAGTFVARLVHEVRRRARDLDAAAHLASAMGAGSDVDWAPEAICQATREACEADVAVLLEGEILRAAVGPGPEVAAVSAGSEVAAARSGLTIEAMRGQHAFTGRVPVLAVPVLRADGPVGVLAVAWNSPGRHLPERAETAVTLFAGVAAAIFEREERLSGERERRALEINDSVVQGLVVAKYALAGGRTGDVERAVDETLARARDLMNRQLGDVSTDVKPGDLRREKPGLDR